MSRSFVGSSSSSTFGSPISRRMSCRRRRSPPERSATNVHWRLPPKPKRSQSCPAVSSRPSPSDDARADGLQRLAARAARRRAPPGAARAPRAAPSAPRSTTPCDGASVAGQQAQQRRLARAVDAHDADAVAGAEAPRDAPQERPVAELDRRVLDVEHRLAEPSGREAQQLGAVARLGLVGDQRVGRVDAEARLGRARRRAAAQPGELLAQQVATALLARGGDAARARPAPAPRPRSRRRTAGRAPSSTSHVRSQTASRNQRSCVTTTTAPRRAARWRASQSTPSRSRWFVGSSSSSSSGPSSSSRASATRRRSPPESGPMTVSSPLREARQVDAAERAEQHVADARVARPLVVGQRRRRRSGGWCASGSRSSAWPSSADAQAGGVRHAPGVGLLAARDQVEQRRLAAAVAARRRRCARPPRCRARRRRAPARRRTPCRSARARRCCAAARPSAGIVGERPRPARRTPGGAARVSQWSCAISRICSREYLPRRSG